MVVIRFPEGRYEGEVSETRDPHGLGCIEFPGNDALERQIYEGHFVNKVAHGQGLLRWREGEKFEGAFENGLRHGTGSYFSKATGAKYDGQYVADKKEGHGRYVYPNGDVYDGQWQNDRRHGTGSYTYKEGGVFTGQWSEGQKNGDGMYVFHNGDVFKGVYENGVRHGNGTLVKADGEEREEAWKQGKLISFKVTKEKSA